VESQSAGFFTHAHLELINAFGNSFVVVARPETALFKLYPLTTWWLLSGGGTILSVLLSFFIGSLKNHRLQLEQKVKERTAALQESEERFSQISELCGEIIWEVDNNGIYTYISRPCTTLLGYKESEIVNTLSIFDIHPDNERDAFHTHFFACVSQRSSIVNFYNHLKSKDGRILHIITNAAPVINQDGTLRGYRGSDLDISAIKQSEIEKEKLQTELVQAQKMESIGRLAGGIAHDFNNMLCTIIGNTEIAIEQCRDKNVSILPLADVLKAAERSSDLTRQLLAFARKQIVNPVTLDINSSISSIYTMLKRLIGENIDLKWVPGKNLLKVKIDGSQIDQILANLVVNARDAINGIGTIVIETAPVVFSDEYCLSNIESRPGKFTMIAVSDNGSGMDQETLSHLFEPFFTTKALGQGTGLGLATVYGIVKQNRGFIHVYSEPAKGTSFRMYLPGIETEINAPSIDTKAVSLSGGTETILVVEDERSILEFIDITLRKLGYNVIKTTSPHEAIEAAKAQKNIHLVLTDVILPKMNGKELVLKLKALIPGIKCLYMSGYTANVIAHHGILDEGINFLQKPFNRIALSEKIRSILDMA
jgi:PAS domain S-box-containing protein